jgi:hypothetical protein
MALPRGYLPAGRQGLFQEIFYLNNQIVRHCFLDLILKEEYNLKFINFSH